MSHYEYIRAIALAWIEPEEYGPQEVARKRKSREDNSGSEVSMRSRTRRARNAAIRSSSSTVSGLTNEDTNANGTTSHVALTNATVNDRSLNPSNGNLKCCMNVAVQHRPEHPKGKKPRCQLHRWARGRTNSEVMAGIIHCSICHVDLCVTCFNTFHTEPNLVEHKAAIIAVTNTK